MDEIRERVIYHGNVQGVGFRQTVASLARALPVVGTVRNLPDGTVELIVRGPESVVRQFQQAIADQFAGNITEAVFDIDLTAIEWHGFQILR